MTRIEEGSLSFDFGERWQVFKLDEHPYYRERMEKLDGTKSVDFLGILDGKLLYLIEVKDFRGYRIESKKRLSNGNLAIEVAQKVRDSLACIIGAYHHPIRSELWKPYANLICDMKSKIIVVLWLEYELPDHLKDRHGVKTSAESNVLKSKLKWLECKTHVCSIDKNELPDLRVGRLSSER